MNYTYAKIPGYVSCYRVRVDDMPPGSESIGTVTKNMFGPGWYAYPVGRVKPPKERFPTRKAAGEWLVAASGLWLVKP